MIRGVIFDLDGTLVDSWTVHRRCLRYAAEATGAGILSAAKIATAQRATDVETLRSLVGPERLDSARHAYRRELQRSLRRDAALAMPGAEATLHFLRRGGFTVGVCTGRSRDDAQALLDASGLRIDLTVAREDARHPKPAPDGLLTALSLLGLSAGEALYVGDSEPDALQGEAAGVRTLLVQSPKSAPKARAADDGCRLTQLFDLAATLREDR
jgi:HAD superfamily hydrolase (TIGR01509 family)